MYNRAQEPRSKRQLTDNLFMNNLQPRPSTQLTTTGRPMTRGLKLIGLSLILLLGLFAANSFAQTPPPLRRGTPARTQPPPKATPTPAPTPVPVQLPTTPNTTGRARY